MGLQDITRPVRHHLDAVETVMKTYLLDTNTDFVKKMALHAVKKPGKRVRAALILLSYFACCDEMDIDPEESLENAVEFAAAVECIHLASLMHDDIIDESDTRRGQAALHAKFGTNGAMIMAVYIYAISLKFIERVGNFEILGLISDTVKHLCEGELQQMDQRDSLNMTLDSYFETIEGKTAVLFAASTFGGALIAGAHDPLAQSFKLFGRELGLIFQITDDYLDLFGSALDLGKTPGQDIISGEFTLPFHYLMESIPTTEQRALVALIRSGEAKAAQKKIRELLTPGVKTKSKATIETHMKNAEGFLTGLKDSPYKRALLEINALITKRCF
ncbi:MAG: polyprenyl synthetase family protein [bacterium]|nr:polyprenyl synthetase family protein [bacterium]